MTTKTFFMIKPDAVAQGLIGACLTTVEDAGLSLTHLRMLKRFSLEDVDEFYAAHVGQPYYAAHAAFMTSGPVLGACVVGHDAIRRLRDLVGATNPKDAESQTLRARFGRNLPQNAVHASDSPDAARRELRLFFRLIPRAHHRHVL